MEAISGNEQNQWGHYYVLLLAVIAPASWTTFCMCWEARTCLTKGEPPQSTQWSVMTQGKSPNLYFWKVCLKALNAWYLWQDVTLLFVDTVNAEKTIWSHTQSLIFADGAEDSTPQYVENILKRWKIITTRFTNRFANFKAKLCCASLSRPSVSKKTFVFERMVCATFTRVLHLLFRFNIWMRIASMNDRRAGFTVSVVDNRLYALGKCRFCNGGFSISVILFTASMWAYILVTACRSVQSFTLDQFLPSFCLCLW